MDNYLIIGIIAVIVVIAIGTLVKRSGRKCNRRSPTATGAVVNGHSAVRQRPA